MEVDIKLGLTKKEQNIIWNSLPNNIRNKLRDIFNNCNLELDEAKTRVDFPAINKQVIKLYYLNAIFDKDNLNTKYDEVSDICSG